MEKQVAFTFEEFTGIFDMYCEDVLIMEDRRMSRKESERLKDFHIYIESIYITQQELRA